MTKKQKATTNIITIILAIFVFLGGFSNNKKELLSHIDKLMKEDYERYNNLGYSAMDGATWEDLLFIVDYSG